MRFPEITLRLPGWVEDLLPHSGQVYPTVEDRVRLAIELARWNVHYRTSWPFGAAIFDQNTNKLLAPGVNIVVAAGYSTAHAEIMAIAIAQQLIGDFDLGEEGRPPYELVASAEPCTRCLGAIHWSGVRHLACGAQSEDTQEVGFDEGPKPAGWMRSLEERGITVARDVCREEAVSVLRQYAGEGGEI